jgi:outer membrane protein OmpA-like peptidoglycan-associated protein
MLVLYVLTFQILKKKEEQYKVKAEQYDRLLDLENSLKPLDDKENFYYDTTYKRFTLKKKINFLSGSAEIPSRDYESLKSAGRKLASVVNNVKKKNNIKYLVIIEGMSSKDAYAKNYELSYERAKAVYAFWVSKGIYFDSSIAEILIAGSGTGGAGRNTYEALNQRILVQIVPKIGK